jgi:hypothetical protein
MRGSAQRRLQQHRLQLWPGAADLRAGFQQGRVVWRARL